MKGLDERGAAAVFPKFLKCLNCGCEALVESYDDMEKSLPGFGWLPAPPNPPGLFQFGCPNNCGASYVSACSECRQQFHYESSISFGGQDDPTHVRFGERKMIELTESDPAAPRRHRFVHRRAPRRRRGDSDGPVPQS